MHPSRAAHFCSMGAAALGSLLYPLTQESFIILQKNLPNLLITLLHQKIYTFSNLVIGFLVIFIKFPLMLRSYKLFRSCSKFIVFRKFKVHYCSPLKPKIQLQMFKNVQKIHEPTQCQLIITYLSAISSSFYSSV